MPNLRRVWYPTRSSKASHLTLRRKRFYRSITGAEIEEEVNFLTLTNKQFLMLALCYQSNIYYIIQLIEIVKQMSGIMIFITISILQLIVGIPLIILLIFMSSYSKKGFLKFWDCLPILRGIGYTILFMRFIYILNFALFSAIGLICAINMLLHPDIAQSIENCDYDTKNLCLPMYPEVDNNFTCTLEGEKISQENLTEYVFFSTQYYFRHIIMQYDTHQTKITKNYNLIFAVLFIWFLIFILSIFGMKRIKKIILNVHNFCYFTQISIIFFAMLSNWGYENEFSLNISSIAKVNMHYWIYIFLHSTDIFILSDVIWCGKMKPKTLSVNNAGCLISLLKVITFLIVIFFSRKSSQLIFNHYKFTDQHCLVISGFDMIFAFLPDVVYRIDLGVYINWFWYVSISYTSFHLTLYTVISVVNALTEHFRRLKNYRVFIYASFCFCSFSCNLFFCTNFATSDLYVFNYYNVAFLTIITLIFLLWGLTYVYSIQRIVEDFRFCKYYPSPYFVTGVKVITIFSLCVFIYMLTYINHYVLEHYRENYRMLYLAVVKNVVFFIPILLIFGFKCYTSMKSKNRKKLSCLSRIKQAASPAKTWGPFEISLKTSRKLFFSRRDEIYHQIRLEKCSHNCLANSSEFREALFKQAYNLDLLRSRIELQTQNEKTQMILMEINKLTKAKHIRF